MHRSAVAQQRYAQKCYGSVCFVYTVNLSQIVKSYFKFAWGNIYLNAKDSQLLLKCYFLLFEPKILLHDIMINKSNDVPSKQHENQTSETYDCRSSTRNVSQPKFGKSQSYNTLHFIESQSYNTLHFIESQSYNTLHFIESQSYNTLHFIESQSYNTLHFIESQSYNTLHFIESQSYNTLHFIESQSYNTLHFIESQCYTTLHFIRKRCLTVICFQNQKGRQIQAGYFMHLVTFITST